MITITIQEVKNGYLVQRYESREQWQTSLGCHGEPYVYRTIAELQTDLPKLFENKEVKQGSTYVKGSIAGNQFKMKFEPDTLTQSNGDYVPHPTTK